MGTDGRTRILILGGGFGGLYVAIALEKTLARHPGVEITLINRENFFLLVQFLTSRAPSISHLEESGEGPGVPETVAARSTR